MLNNNYSFQEMEAQVRKSLEGDETFSKQRDEIQAKIDQEIKSRKFIMLMVYYTSTCLYNFVTNCV